jgi:hypothetical protein
LAAVCVVLVVALVLVRNAARHTAAELAALQRRLDGVEERLVRAAEPEPPAATPVEFVITDLGRPEPPTAPVHLDGPAFADVVLRETVVKAASLVHGIRRGLAPETRNRIRFEMRQEVRRSRKQRRADLKTAARHLHAQQRADLARRAS